VYLQRCPLRRMTLLIVVEDCGVGVDDKMGDLQMNSIIAKALKANAENEAEASRHRDLEAQVLQNAEKLYLTLQRPLLTIKLGAILGEDLPEMPWIAWAGMGSEKSEQRFTHRKEENGTYSVSARKLIADLFGVLIVVDVMPGPPEGEGDAHQFSVRQTSKNDVEDTSFRTLVEFGAAVKRHYPRVAAEHSWEL
jgi:hypothetical protein